MRRVTRTKLWWEAIIRSIIGTLLIDIGGLSVLNYTLDMGLTLTSIGWISIFWTLAWLFWNHYTRILVEKYYYKHL